MGAHHLVQEGAVLVNEGDDIEKLMYTSAHHELVASALAVKACHEIDHDAMIGCMIGMNGVYPDSPDPHDVLNAQKAMLQKYYYVEVQARGEIEARGAYVAVRHHQVVSDRKSVLDVAVPPRL